MLRFLVVWSWFACATLLHAQGSAPVEDGRILGVIPNNKTVPQLVPADGPLTSRGKFDLAFKDTIDPYTVVLAGFYAGLSQWQNDYAAFGLGGEGYAKRLGAAYADQAVGNYMTEA